jgi:GntR family transcriptional regulator
MGLRVGLGKSEQVAQTIEDDIRRGMVTHGEQLDSEFGLMQRFSVSRNTVRRGLEILARQGLITTRTGIGSFVTYDGTPIDSNLGWTVAMRDGAASVETHVLDLRRGPCPIADGFLGGTGDYLIIDRLRYCLDCGYGISLERSRLPWRPDYDPILSNGLRKGSLSLTLAGLGLAAANGEEIAGVAASLTPTEATIMGREEHSPMLSLIRTTRTENGEVLEYVKSLLDPERFGLRMAF